MSIESGRVCPLKVAGCDCIPECICELDNVSVHCNPRVCTTSGLVLGPEDKKGQCNARLAGGFIEVSKFFINQALR